MGGGSPPWALRYAHVGGDSPVDAPHRTLSRVAPTPLLTGKQMVVEGDPHRRNGVPSGPRVAPGSPTVPPTPRTVILCSFPPNRCRQSSASASFGDGRRANFLFDLVCIMSFSGPVFFFGDMIHIDTY